jgi:divalent metal cation (Fe/Co/Zn/Cd) transporter
MVIRAGWQNTSSALFELADASIEDEVKASVRRAACKGIAALSNGTDVEVKEVQGVKSGPNYLIDLELAVPKHWTVEDVRVIEEIVRERVGAKVRGTKRVKLRFVPKENGDFADEFIGPDVNPSSSPEPESDSESNDHDNGHEHHHDQSGKDGSVKSNDRKG